MQSLVHDPGVPFNMEEVEQVSVHIHRHTYTQGVVTFKLPVEAFMTGINILDWQNSLDCLILLHQSA